MIVGKLERLNYRLTKTMWKNQVRDREIALLSGLLYFLLQQNAPKCTKSTKMTSVKVEWIIFSNKTDTMLLSHNFLSILAET